MPPKHVYSMRFCRISSGRRRARDVEQLCGVHILSGALGPTQWQQQWLFGPCQCGFKLASTHTRIVLYIYIYNRVCQRVSLSEMLSEAHINCLAKQWPNAQHSAFTSLEFDVYLPKTPYSGCITHKSEGLWFVCDGVLNVSWLLT